MPAKKEKMENHTFETLDLSSEIRRAIDKLQLTTPTSVQKEAIPVMMDGYNLIAQAPTGTGKTFAYGIPILEYLRLDVQFVQDLILCPTRELALQICTEIRTIGQFIPGLKVCPIIGGQSFDRQLKDLRIRRSSSPPGRLSTMLIGATSISRPCTP